MTLKDVLTKLATGFEPALISAVSGLTIAVGSLEKVLGNRDRPELAEVLGNLSARLQILKHRCER
jgi:hypothetical protein